jgi:hypothetical protein
MGASLVFADPTLLPTDFDIQVAQWKEAFRGRLVWRQRPAQVGVVLAGCTGRRLGRRRVAGEARTKTSSARSSG